MSFPPTQLFPNKDQFLTTSEVNNNISTHGPPSSKLTFSFNPNNITSESVDNTGNRSEEEYPDDEDSVNIDGYDEENRDLSPGSVKPQERTNSGFIGFNSYPNPYLEDGHRSECGSAFAKHPCDSDRSRELGHFSAFRYLNPNTSPRRHSEEYGYAKDQRTVARSESPENLCSASKSGDLLDYSGRQAHPNSTMLEHKLPFNFLGPPLAALHSMTEMKSSLGGVAGGDSNNNNTSAPSMSSPNAGHTAQTMHGQANAPNPHGIDTILSRPPPVTSAGLSSLTAGEGSRTALGCSRPSLVYNTFPFLCH